MSDVFCRSSLSEVVSVERRLRSDALLKRDELRELVGSRYRSLLACADAIHQMSVLGQEGEEQLQALHRTLLALGSKAAALSASASEEEETLRVKRCERLAASQHLSTLLHATERVLAALDRRDVLEAAQLYMDAQSAAQYVLESKQDATIVWSEVWDGVQQCCALVNRAARDVLWSAHSAASDRNALRALCLLHGEEGESANSPASLQLLLSARTPTEAEDAPALRAWALVLRRTLEEVQQWFSDGLDQRCLHDLCGRWWKGVVDRIVASTATVRQSAEERDEILSALYSDDGARVWSTAARFCTGRELDVWSEAFHSRVCTLLLDEASDVNHHLADNLHTHLQQLDVRVSSSERHWGVLRAVDPNSSTLHHILECFQTDLDAMLSHHQRLRCTSLSTKWQQTRLVEFIESEVAPATQESAEQALRRVVEALQQAMANAERMSEGANKVETVWFLCRLSFGVAQVCEGVPSSMSAVLESFWALIDASLADWIMVATRDARLQLVAAVRDAFDLAQCVDTRTSPYSELVPVDASPFALVYLNAVAKLIDAVYYESVAQSLLERLLSQLLQSSASLFEEVLDDIDNHASSISEGFFVQLLFDASFMLSSSSAATLERISSHIDPISLASIESQLRDNVELYRQRCSVLLGCLAGGAPGTKGLGAPKPSDPNLIQLLHPSKRLPTFPVALYPSTDKHSDSLKLELEIQNDDEVPRQVPTVSSSLAAASKFLSQVQARRPNFASMFNYQLSRNKNS